MLEMFGGVQMKSALIKMAPVPGDSMWSTWGPIASLGWGRPSDGGDLELPALAATAPLRSAACLRAHMSRPRRSQCSGHSI